ncbi:hypothetical protein SLEP1_g58471 [Rubroshorea leprosula]|uniref:Uncharacterized protein n=1 Tax=Rubroshorea leprosula TaxID=152421 RepID=A0AAV5MTG9_9ROSI|nr:hypothetical protein SLEP1_g58471 [Rubroshorea leprosula]
MLMLRFHHQSSILFFLALALLSVGISAENYMDEFLIDESAVNRSEQVTDQSTVTQSEQVAGQPTVNQSEQVTDQPAVNQSKLVIDAWWFIAGLAGALMGGLLISSYSTSAQLFISAILVGIGCISVYYYSKRYEVSSGDHEGEKHELRPLLKLLPLWAPFLIFYVVDAAGSVFFDYEAYLYIIQKFSGIIVSRLIDYVIIKFCSKVNQQVQQRIRLAKIIFGMLVCFLLCIDAWHVQAKRKSEGSFTFTLQFILLGIMNEMVKEKLGEYFCDQVPDQSMHHLEFTFNGFVEGMGRLLAVVCILVSRNWIDEKIEKRGKVTWIKNSQLDKCFRTLAFMSLCALFMFVYLSNTCYYQKKTEDHDDNLEKLEVGSVSLNNSRPLESQSSSLSSSSILQSTAYFPEAAILPAILPNLESAGSSVNRDYWSIVKRYQICHRFLRYIKERRGAKEKSS